MAPIPTVVVLLVMVSCVFSAAIMGDLGERENVKWGKICSNFIRFVVRYFYQKRKKSNIIPF